MVYFVFVFELLYSGLRTAVAVQLQVPAPVASFPRPQCHPWFLHRPASHTGHRAKTLGQRRGVLPGALDRGERQGEREDTTGDSCPVGGKTHG